MGTWGGAGNETKATVGWSLRDKVKEQQGNVTKSV